MSSLYLTRLKPDDRQTLIARLHAVQHGHCFICEQAIDLVVHKNTLDVDHVVPLNDRGKDDPVNFALTHALFFRRYSKRQSTTALKKARTRA